MLCRLYDTKNKRYIKADETMDYMVHPVGAVFHQGVEDHRIEKELCSGLEDKNGKFIYAGDLISDGLFTKEVRFERGAFWAGDDLEDLLLHYVDEGTFAVIGTIHDEEMEAV